MLDRRIRQEELDHLQLPAHLHRLVATAFVVANAGHPRCRRAANQLGWSGHVLTKSRRWSTTFACLRRARRDWRVAESGERPLPGTTSWRFEGVGLRCEIDRMLALGIEERRRVGRIEGWLARAEPATA